jgi:hypothetical protein
MTPTIEQSKRRAIWTLAQRRARHVVKAELHKQGVRLVEVAAKEISSWAQVYLEDHAAELIAEAKAIVDRWHFGPRGGFRAR